MTQPTRPAAAVEASILTTQQPPPATVTIQIATNAVVAELLGLLQDTGLFGETIEQVAEQLLREKLRELELQGWCGGMPEGRRGSQ